MGQVDGSLSVLMNNSCLLHEHLSTAFLTTVPDTLVESVLTRGPSEYHHLCDEKIKVEQEKG